MIAAFVNVEGQLYPSFCWLFCLVLCVCSWIFFSCKDVGVNQANTLLNQTYVRSMCKCLWVRVCTCTCTLVLLLVCNTTFCEEAQKNKTQQKYGAADNQICVCVLCFWKVGVDRLVVFIMFFGGEVNWQEPFEWMIFVHHIKGSCTNRRNKGWTSADRSTKATLMLTVPRSLLKSSTMDLTWPTLENIIAVWCWHKCYCYTQTLVKVSIIAY